MDCQAAISLNVRIFTTFGKTAGFPVRHHSRTNSASVLTYLSVRFSIREITTGPCPGSPPTGLRQLLVTLRVTVRSDRACRNSSSAHSAIVSELLTPHERAHREPFFDQFVELASHRINLPACIQAAPNTSNEWHHSGEAVTYSCWYFTNIAALGTT